MASQPAISEIPPEFFSAEDERQLTREEGWALITSLFGSAKEMYAEVGGAEAWIAAERADWGD
jgi:hypothetical protein